MVSITPLNSDISRALSYMGHTDRLCIGDCGLPIPEETGADHQPVEEMGRKAVEILFRYVAGEQYETQCVFDVSLVERETTRRRQNTE